MMMSIIYYDGDGSGGSDDGNNDNVCGQGVINVTKKGSHAFICKKFISSKIIYTALSMIKIIIKF